MRLSTIIILMRHGETSWNKKSLLQGRTDIPLCDKGREQAKTLSKALSSLSISAIYSSPLSRALETAQILGIPHSITPKTSEGFTELNYGEWEGKSPETLRTNASKQYRQWLVDPKEVIVPASERLSDVQLRVMKSFDSVVKENEGKLVALVGHGGVNRVMLLSLLQADLGSFWRIRQDTTCLNLIELSDQGPKISLMNWTAHSKSNYEQIIKEAMARVRIHAESND